FIGGGKRFEGIVPFLALEADTPTPQELQALNRRLLRRRRCGNVLRAGHGPLLRRGRMMAQRAGGVHARAATGRAFRYKPGKPRRRKQGRHSTWQTPWSSG